MTTAVQARAPGKIHLIGEHSVVYGEPALLAAINKFTTVSCRPAQHVSVIDQRTGKSSHFELARSMELYELASKEWEAGAVRGDFSHLIENLKANDYQNYTGAALGLLFKHFGARHGVHIEIESELPRGSGLGSSASLACALTASLAKFYEVAIDKNQLNELAFAQEKLAHGRPSGGDNAICTWGGVMEFVRNQQGQSFIESIQMPKSWQFIIIESHPPLMSTADIVEQVARQTRSERDPIVKNLGQLARELKSEILSRQPCFKRAGRIFNDAQKNLSDLGVSTPQVDEICQHIVDFGGGGKLCGAGTGGAIIAIHPDMQALADRLSQLKLRYEWAEIADSTS